jgi:hypothetical protein
MKKFLTLLLLLVFSFSFAQNVNQYKYALVPSKFTFLKKNDEYRLNTLTKLLMEKYGFVAYLDSDVMPDEVLKNSCNKVYVDVVSEGNMFTAKLKVILSDCQRNVLFTSSVGKSKYKEYKDAYTDALRQAFDSFVLLHYKYTPAPVIPSNTVLNEVVPAVAMVPDAATSAIANEIAVPVSGILFAQPIVNGFQLVDSSPKVVMKIYNTSIKNYFIALKGNVQGVLVTKENRWYFEYYQSEKLVSQEIEVKF